MGTMASKIRWGILGTGNIAKKFAEGLAAVEDAELVAVGSRSQDNAHSFGDRFKIPHRHASYEALAADPDVEVIYVATPHPLHMENTLLCLKNGKAVLCEKPFALNTAQARKMVSLARKKKVFLMEGMWMNFFPAIAKMRELITQGAIGEVRLMRADLCFRAGFNPESRLFNPQLGGGALLDVGVYTVAFAHAVFGRAPERITSIPHLGETGVDEQAAMILGYPGGAMAVLTCAVRTNSAHEAMIYGTDGWIRMPPLFWQPDKLIVCKGGKEEEISFKRLGNGFAYEAMEVGRCLREDKIESDIAPHEKTLDIMRTLDKLRKQWDLKYPGE
jgi:predicted dehydrogenase